MQARPSSREANYENEVPLPQRFVSFRFVSFRFVSFRFVSFRFVSFREMELCVFGKFSRSVAGIRTQLKGQSPKRVAVAPNDVVEPKQPNEGRVIMMALRSRLPLTVALALFLCLVHNAGTSITAYEVEASARR
jgi:hypothetical protein